MARKRRVEYAGAIYHPLPLNFGATNVVNRGNRREHIFKDDTDLPAPHWTIIVVPSSRRRALCIAAQG
jgi:hypothetical protein